MTLTAVPTSRSAFHRRHNTLPRFLGTGSRNGHRPAPPLDHVEPEHGAKAPATVSGRPDPGVLLADLTSPLAYLAHLRLDRPELPEEGRPEWFAVQPASGRPLTGLRRGDPVPDRLRAELETARSLAGPDEEIPDALPPVVPHPRPVAAAYAEAVDLGRGPEARALLMRAYWREGRDIGDPEVLRRLLPAVLVDDDALCTGDPRREFGYVVGPARGPLTDNAYHLMRRWQQQWEELGSPGPLVHVGPHGTRTGGAALDLALPTVGG